MPERAFWDMNQIKGKFAQLIEKCKPQNKKQEKIWIISLTALLAVILIVTSVLIFAASKEDEVTYKETQTVIGNLAEGITESGSVDVGTTVQSFELDISEFTGTGSFSFGTGGQGADMMMNMMSGQLGSESSSDRQLEIEEVYVEAGQEIEAGAPILKLTQESVESIRTELSEDVTNAELLYNQAVTAQKQAEVSAEGEYKINSLYGSYAQAEYDKTVSQLAEAVETAQETLSETEEKLAEAQEELTEKETLLAEEKQVLENALFTAEGTDKENALYWWIVAYQTAETAQEMVSTLEDEIEQIKEDIEAYTEEKSENEISLALTEKELESGEITARGQFDMQSYYALNAEEIYNVAVEQSAFETEKAKEDYDEAEEKLAEFDDVIVEQVISAEDNGVITGVYVAEGDYLTQNMDMISLNNYDEVTITVSVEEDDLEAAALGKKANVTLAAFEDKIFTGTVTEIGDAEIDSSTNKTMYSVTVTVDNTGMLLYQDMTAEVTFVTDEVSEVLYIPVRAVSEEENVKYVKVKNEDGTISTREITTGFSDGINIEIKEGLSEGETVLIESKVKKS